MNKELELSYQILHRIYTQNAFSQIELNRAIKNTNLNSGLITKIVYGVLENDILLNYHVSKFFTKNPKKSVLVIFKIGAYVGHYLNGIPHYALVSELVNLVKKFSPALAGFTNATLKKIVSTPIELPSTKNIEYYLSVKHSYPQWLVKMLIEQYGVVFTRELLAAKLTQFTHVRANNRLTNAKRFEEMLVENNIDYEKGQLENGFFVDYEKLLTIPELDKYYVVIGQMSMNLIDIINPQEKSMVFDACASPGGKSLYLSEISPTSNIIAGDLHPHRVNLIHGLVNKYNAKNITPILNDATVLNKNYVSAFDLVVCDVPCSGIGVVGKKPDILLNRTEKDIENLAQLQYDILATSSHYVREGGQLYYSTCTLLKQENEEVVEKFLANYKNFELQPINEVNSIKNVKTSEMITYTPNISNAEGFFIAKLQRRKSN